MAAPKIKTLQARFGFADPDLKEPKHDEIIKWVGANAEDILMVVLKLSERPKEVEGKWEPLVRMTEEGGQYIGFMDMRVKALVPSSTFKGKTIFERNTILFEAKTAIESLGELFRQLNLYRSGYLGGLSVWNLPIVVVCPDDTNAQTIHGQGFHFLKYDPEMQFPFGGV